MYEDVSVHASETTCFSTHASCIAFDHRYHLCKQIRLSVNTCLPDWPSGLEGVTCSFAVHATSAAQVSQENTIVP